jgi:hypothetical protein
LILQEPDASTWTVQPESRDWLRMKDAVLRAFQIGGGFFNAGLKLPHLLHDLRFENTSFRSACLKISGDHPYKRVLSQFAQSLKPRILEHGLLENSDYDQILERINAIAQKRETTMTSFTTVQAWARKPA